MAESELYQKGTEMRTQLMGAATVDKLAQTVYDDPMMKKFADYACEAVFGMLWTRPGLDLKTKTLICVISDTAESWRLPAAVTSAPPLTTSSRRRMTKQHENQFRETAAASCRAGGGLAEYRDPPRGGRP